jgi:probable blue pigment (indigoidine) exporter
VLAKIVLGAGVDVVSMLSFRSLVGLAFVATWFRFGRRPAILPGVRTASLIIGIIFAGLIFCLFKAIETIDVPTAVLSHFTYPLLTGITASLFGLEPLRWKGILCAAVAFFGLALLIDAHPAGLAFLGVIYAVGAACCRTGVLLVTRDYLVGADARLTTWYSMLSSTGIFVAASFARHACTMPQTSVSWACLAALSFAATAAILLVFLSTVRIGPFRTAVIMHLEPLTATILSTVGRRSHHARARPRDRLHAGGSDRISIVAMRAESERFSSQLHPQNLHTTRSNTVDSNCRPVSQTRPTLRRTFGESQKMSVIKWEMEPCVGSITVPSILRRSSCWRRRSMKRGSRSNRSATRP